MKNTFLSKIRKENITNKSDMWRNVLHKENKLFL